MLGELSHVTLWVDNFDDVLRFYTDILGLDVAYQDEHFASLENDGATLYLHDRTDGFRDWSTELRFQVDDVDRAAETLRARGAEPIFGPMDRPWGIRIAGFRDPAGHIVEVARPLTPTERASSASDSEEDS